MQPVSSSYPGHSQRLARRGLTLAVLLRRAAAHHADMPKLIEIARAGRAELRSLFEQDRR